MSPEARGFAFLIAALPDAMSAMVSIHSGHQKSRIGLRWSHPARLVEIFHGLRPSSGLELVRHARRKFRSTTQDALLAAPFRTVGRAVRALLIHRPTCQEVLTAETVLIISGRV